MAGDSFNFEYGGHEWSANYTDETGELAVLSVKNFPNRYASDAVLYGVMCGVVVGALVAIMGGGWIGFWLTILACVLGALMTNYIGKHGDRALVDGAFAEAQRLRSERGEQREREERERAEAHRRWNEQQDRERREFEAKQARENAAREAETRRQRDAEEAWKKLIAAPIPLRLNSTGIVFGTDLQTRETVVLPVQNLRHMLVCGTTGYGKSVFLHEMVSQLVGRNGVELCLVDMKAGMEFNVYAGRPGVRVVWEYADVLQAVASLEQQMNDRLREAARQRARVFNGSRLFFIVDEFAQIEQWRVPKKDTEARELHDRLMVNLLRLSQVGRAANIVIIAATQKATTDAMDSSLRVNLDARVCFRTTVVNAGSMFGCPSDELPADPARLPKGRGLFFVDDKVRLLQVHQAPEAKR